MLLLAIFILGAVSVRLLSRHVDEVYVGKTTILAQRSLQPADIDQRLLFPAARIQSLLTQDIRLRQETLERDYHQDTYRMTTTASPEHILAYYQNKLPAFGWKYVCAPRAVDGPLVQQLDGTCLGDSGSFAASWKAHALFTLTEHRTYLNVIIYPPSEQERVVEVIKIAVYEIRAFDTFIP